MKSGVLVLSEPGQNCKAKMSPDEIREAAAEALAAVTMMDWRVCQMPGDGYCFFHALVHVALARRRAVDDALYVKMYVLALGSLCRIVDLHETIGCTEKERYAREVRLREQCPDIAWHAVAVEQSYVIDKMMQILSGRRGLDSCGYADTPEILAVLKCLGVNVLLIDVPLAGTGSVLPSGEFLQGVAFTEACEHWRRYDGVFLYWGGSHYDVVEPCMEKECHVDLGAPRLQSLWQECKPGLLEFLRPVSKSTKMTVFLDTLEFEDCQHEAEGSAAERKEDPHIQSGVGEVEVEEAGDQMSTDEELEGETNIQVQAGKTWQTDQDREDEAVCKLVGLLRDRPLMPIDLTDPEGVRSWADASTGNFLPLVHGAFKGCAWTGDTLGELQTHLCTVHALCLSGVLHSCALQKKVCEENLAWYCAAIRKIEQENMSVVSPSIDRRTIAHIQQVYSSDTIQMLICFCCAAKKLALATADLSEIGFYYGCQLMGLPKKTLEDNLGLREFQRRYGHGVAFQSPTGLEDRGWFTYMVGTWRGCKMFDIKIWVWGVAK